jgi:hypothetical protein
MNCELKTYSPHQCWQEEENLCPHKQSGKKRDWLAKTFTLTPTSTLSPTLTSTLNATLTSNPNPNPSPYINPNANLNPNLNPYPQPLPPILTLTISPFHIVPFSMRGSVCEFPECLNKKKLSGHYVRPYCIKYIVRKSTSPPSPLSGDATDYELD